MTKEQAVNLLDDLSEYGLCYNITEEYQEAMKLVLSVLEEKDKQIDKLKKHNDNLLIKIRNRVKQVKKLEKYSLYKEEFSRLNKQLQNKDKQIERYINILVTNDMLHVIECENKDKIIDLMANKLALYCEINCEEDIKTNKEQIRQYFENKVKEK